MNRITHLDEHPGSGYAACGESIWPRRRLDEAPAAAAYPGFCLAAQLGTACTYCFREIGGHDHTTEEVDHKGEAR